MELDQLKAFIIVAEEKNITKASERLFITQPALSTKLKLLEDELQVELFNRTPKGMELTETGEILTIEAKKIVDAAEQLKILL
jgi:DNA-binding transcriptional LysR family regulator